jgi:hypothetical protein
MATYTSSQSGLWSSSATWGGAGVPNADGDIFNIAPGHIVTLNDTRMPTNGFDNSNVQGKLIITSTGKLRMNGQLNIDMVTGATKHFVEADALSGAYFLMQPGSRVEITGVDADQHGIVKTTTNAWVIVEMEGTHPMAYTTVASTNVVTGDYYVTVASSTGFVAGDWATVQIKLEDIDDYERARFNTEGFIVHDVDGNNIYMRHFVGPTATISSATGTSVVVDNSKVFRVGHKIIFGTGANRNTREITAINNLTNTLTINTSITGTVTGQTVYRSGFEKFHTVGTDVKKLATRLTANANSGQAIINVASTNGMTVGTRLIIEANNPSDTGWDYEMRYTISAINGNQITLTSNLANNRLTDALVFIYDRDTVVAATNLGDSTNRVFVYFRTNSYYNCIRLRNVLFDGIGRNTLNTLYGGVIVYGITSYENNAYAAYASGYEGCVISSNFRSTYNGLNIRDNHQFTIRSCLAYNVERGFWKWSGGNNDMYMNNAILRCNFGIVQDTMYEPYTSIEYNYVSRSSAYAYYLAQHRDASTSIRHNYAMFSVGRPLYMYYNGHNRVIHNCYFDYFYYWPYHGTPGGDLLFLNCYFGNKWDITGGAGSPVNGLYVADDDYPRPRRGNGDETKSISLQHNYEQDAVVEWASYAQRTWDTTEGCWFVKRTIHSSVYAGFNYGVFVPAGASVNLEAYIKLTSNFSGTYPYFAAYTAEDYSNGAWGIDGQSAASNSTESTGGYPSGFLEQTQFTSAAIGNWESKTLTIAAQKYDYFLSMVVFTTSTDAGNGTEGYWEAPIRVTLTDSSGLKSKRNLGEINLNYAGVSNSQIRLGGRLQ